MIMIMLLLHQHNDSRAQAGANVAVSSRTRIGVPHGMLHTSACKPDDLVLAEYSALLTALFSLDWSHENTLPSRLTKCKPAKVPLSSGLSSTCIAAKTCGYAPSQVCLHKLLATTCQRGAHRLTARRIFDLELRVCNTAAWQQRVDTRSHGAVRGDTIATTIDAREPLFTLRKELHTPPLPSPRTAWPCEDTTWPSSTARTP